LPRGSVVISATNGKTTTAALSGSILAHAGIATIDNFAGANMAGGNRLGAAGEAAAVAGRLRSSACSRLTSSGSPALLAHCDRE